jgi:hypothetical protein
MGCFVIYKMIILQISMNIYYLFMSHVMALFNYILLQLIQDNAISTSLIGIWNTFQSCINALEMNTHFIIYIIEFDL